MKNIDNLKSWIGNRLYAIFALLIVIPLTIVGVVSYSHSIHIIETNLKRYVDQLVEESSNSVDIYMKEVEKTTLKTSKQPSVIVAASKPDAISSATAVQSRNSSNFRSAVQYLFEDFKDLYESHNDIKHIYLATSDGRLYSYPSIIFERTFDPRYISWYTNVMGGDSLVWDKPFLDSKSNTMLVKAAVPVYSQDKTQQQPIGVLAVEISLADISSKLGNMYIGKKSHPYIMTEYGRIVAHPDSALLGTILPYKDVISAVNSKSEGTVDYVYEDSNALHHQFAVFKRINPANWTLVADICIDDMSGDSQNLFLSVFIVGGIALALALFISSRFSRALTNNVRHLIKTAHVQASDLARKNDELDFIANHDPLTELPNRRLLIRHLDSALQAARSNGSMLSLMFLDLDRFKNVNDSLGHDTGDQLLIAVSRRILENVRKNDTVCRQGGDEFIVLLEDIRSRDEVTGISSRILESFKEPFLLKNHEINMTISIGACIYPGDGNTAEALMKHTDIAMYSAKENGKNSMQFFDSSMSLKVSRKTVLENDLHKALENGELQLHYQPQFELKTGTLSGMEALLRWTHPSFGNVPPNEFIPLAEDSGLIVPIGEWVLCEACSQAKKLCNLGLRVKTAVNISPRQFVQPDFMDMVRSALSKAHLEPRLLQLEITEGIAIYNEEHTISMLEQLNDMGVTTSIDDFGTGYSSLSLLRRLPIQTLKIDKSFINGVPDNLDDISIINAITALAKNLRLDIIAEGVEEAAQMDFLKGIGCDKVQGYYTGRPMPADEFEKRFLAL